MGSQFAQCVVPGQIGTVRLHGDIEEVTGSQGNDSIITSANTTIVNGVSGSDAIILNGDAQTVTTLTLNGRGQSVVARGDGAYTINIANGDYSIVNALVATNNIAFTSAGRNVIFYGGKGVDTVNVTGDYNYINTGAGNDKISISGSYATVLAGEGDDFVGFGTDINNAIFSTGNIIYGEGGNDFIGAAFTMGTNFLYAGAGDDIVIGGIGADFIYGMSGNNVLIGNAGEDRIFGGIGRDLILANTTTNLAITPATFKKVDYDKLQANWSANTPASIAAAIAQLGKQSVQDQSRDWLYRGAGIGNVIYSNSKTDGDIVCALTFSPFNDINFDDITDL